MYCSGTEKARTRENQKEKISNPHPSPDQKSLRTFLSRASNPRYLFLGSTKYIQHHQKHNSMHIPPELIDAALAFVATLVSCLAAYLNKEKNKAKTEKNEEKQKNADLLDLMISEKPMTEGQQKVLDTTPEIEKTFTMSAETESTVYNLLKAAKPSLERGAFNAQITATKSQKLLSYALIAAKDYNDETPAAAVFIDYGLIRSIGTAREIHNTAVIQGAPEIYL